MNFSENPFFEIMSRHSDSKLIDIVENRRDEYNPDALAAAENVLKSRKISWTIKSEEPEEIQFENTRDEISYRLANGESIEVIRNDLKSRGVDVFDYAEKDQEEEAKNDPEFAAKRKKLGLRVGAFVTLFYALINTHSRNHDAGLVFAIIMGIAIILLVLSFVIESDKK